MSYGYWLSLFSSVALLVLGGRLPHFVHPKSSLTPACKQGQGSASAPHPFLCGEKISIVEASVSDLASVEGVSFKKALAMYEFFRHHAHKKIGDVVDVPGVGPKTLEKLRVFFY